MNGIFKNLKCKCTLFYIILVFRLFVFLNIFCEIITWVQKVSFDYFQIDYYINSIYFMSQAINRLVMRDIFKTSFLIITSVTEMGTPWQSSNLNTDIFTFLTRLMKAVTLLQEHFSNLIWDFCPDNVFLGKNALHQLECNECLGFYVPTPHCCCCHRF